MTQNSLAPDAEYVRDNDSFYGMLTAAERKLLQGMAKARTYLPGRALMLEGDPGASLTVLFDGWAKAFSVRDHLGTETVLRFYGPGDIFGVESILGTDRTESVVALAPCHSLLLGVDQFTGLLSQSPGIARAFTLITLRRVRDADERIKAQHDSGAHRLARRLLDLTGSGGAETSGEFTIPIELSQEDLASWADTSRSTVARALRDWRKKGLMRTGYRSITITDPETLRRIVGIS